MKLRLTQERDVQILTTSETVTIKDVQVLNAGVTKLFKNGKNRIILEMTQRDVVPNEILRELSKLDILARELSGRIVIAGLDATTKAKMELYSVPPVIASYSTVADALASFFAAPIPIEPVALAGSNAKAPPAKDDAVTKALESENHNLREALRAMVISRRVPPDAGAYQSRIEELEDQVEQLLKQLNTK